MDVQVFLPSGKEGGKEDVTNLQKWTACGQNVTQAEDPYYYFYRVQACAFKSGTTVEGCISSTKVPAPDKGIVAKIQACTSDSAKAESLVAAMNKGANKVHSFPTIYINGKKDRGSSGKEVVEAICKAAQEQMPNVVRTIPACGGTAPSGVIYE